MSLSRCRFFGHVSIWSPDIVTQAQRLCKQVLAEQGRYLRWIHLRLDKAGDGRIYAQLQIDISNRPLMLASAVNQSGEQVLRDVFARYEQLLMPTPLALSA